MKNGIIPLLLISLFLSACDEKKDPVAPVCEQSVLVDRGFYEDGPDDEFWLQEASISGECLEARIRYGGGCGTIELELVDSEAVLESQPPQRNLRLSLKDDDLCEALLAEERSFDLSPLRVEGSSTVLLNLAGWDEQLEYTY